MRKIVSMLLCLSLLCILCACGSDASIVGAWKADAGGSIIGVDVSTPTTFEVYYIFNDNGTGELRNIFPEGSNHPNTAIQFVYSTDSNAITIDFTDRHEKGTYEIKGNQLTLDRNRTGTQPLTRVTPEDVPEVP